MYRSEWGIDSYHRVASSEMRLDSVGSNFELDSDATATFEASA